RDAQCLGVERRIGIGTHLKAETCTPVGVLAAFLATIRANGVAHEAQGTGSRLRDLVRGRTITEAVRVHDWDHAQRGRWSRARWVRVNPCSAGTRSAGTRSAGTRGTNRSNRWIDRGPDGTSGGHGRSDLGCGAGGGHDGIGTRGSRHVAATAVVFAARY